jgi:hypothetical protein
MHAGKVAGPALIAAGLGVQYAFWTSGMAPDGYWNNTKETKNAATIRVRVSGVPSPQGAAVAKH